MDGGLQTPSISMPGDMNRILIMNTVYLLWEVMPTHNHCVGVFKSRLSANAYADKFNVSSWHVTIHSLWDMDTVKNMK